MDIGKTILFFITAVVIISMGIVVIIFSSNQAEQIDLAENSSNELYISNYNQNQTLNNVGLGISQVSAQTYNHSFMSFDGVNDWINPRNNNIAFNFSTGYSLSAWIRTTINSSSGGVILQLRNTTTNNPTTSLRVFDYTGVTQFLFKSDSNLTGCNTDTSSTGFSKNDGTWHNVVGVFNGSSSELYVDGLLNKTTSWNQGCIDNLNNFAFNGNISMGSLFGSSNWLSASLDEIRIYNSSLNSSQVLQLYQNNRVQNLTLLNESLVAYYPFNENSGTIVYDVIGGNNGQ